MSTALDVSPIATSRASKRQSMLNFMGIRKRAATVSADEAPSTIISSDSSNDQPVKSHASITSPHENGLSSLSPPAPAEEIQSKAKANSTTDLPLSSAPEDASSPKEKDKDKKEGQGFTSRMMKRRSMLPAIGLTSPTTSDPPTSPINPNRPHKIRLVPHLPTSSRSQPFHFEPFLRTLKANKGPLVIGRYVDPATQPLRGMDVIFDLDMVNKEKNSGDAKVTFKTKVVSRTHAHIWVDETGQFWLKDMKSSSGTFLNNNRISPPGQESQPHAIKDGDIIQLGVDFQGGKEENFRAVRIKVEVGKGREWQGSANAFNTQSLQLLKSLKAANEDDSTSSAASGSGSKQKAQKKTHAGAGDCCICLFPLTICQALFVAPCSHVFHYRCVRPLIERHFPSFSCPMCRTFANLDAEVENMENLPTLEKVLADAEPGPEVSWTEKRERRKSLKAVIAGSKVVQSLMPAVLSESKRDVSPDSDPASGTTSALVDNPAGPTATNASETATPAAPLSLAVTEQPDPNIIPPSLVAANTSTVAAAPTPTPSPVTPFSGSGGRGPGLAINTNLLNVRPTLNVNTLPPPVPPVPPLPAGSRMSAILRDPLLTAVSPHSVNPFHTFGMSNEDATPTTSTGASPWATTTPGLWRESFGSPKELSPATPANAIGVGGPAWANIAEEEDEEVSVIPEDEHSKALAKLNGTLSVPGVAASITDDAPPLVVLSKTET